ncbi:4-alpha-glucanotransferase [Paraburkholderia caribensis]|uniref:4-alpha-glucanotransferase n=1 Tax=Paraburkholderia caribensis TaxID=75105 RepID=A0A9Q6S5L9_9BURK|nr:4-alpha-glucanotransferase [Paraburkholderia caribensis]MCO4880785.1 4-alpha-glucanotransferase [Paraburkholderia caribensis]PTB26025.1 4-alpha-glucanotransferase [Paraburkholderia caribensis]QLB64993.1 4-alpha-glucanotransferase [Paraburkholderia caribensis]
MATNRRPGISIDALAARAGFEVEWEDAHHNRKRVPDSTLAALLERMGLPCGNATQIRQSAGALEAELSGRKLPPLMTVECGRGIALPAAAIKSGSHYRIELESGSLIDGRFTAPRGEAALLSPIDEPGYHTLVLNEHRMTLAVAPAQCYTVTDAWRAMHGDDTNAPPLWGIAAQLYGLRRVGDGGIGDYTALATLAIESAKRGAHALAVSPTHAMFSALPGSFSPYSPSSRLWLNVTHIDPAAVFGAQAAQAALDAAGGADVWPQLETLPLIDWKTATPLKLKVLRVLFERFCANDRAQDSPRALEFHGFCERGGRALEDHARFEALHAFQLLNSGEGYWRKWPDALQDPRSPEVEAFANQHRHEVEFHLFLQWLASKGLSHAQHAARDAGMAIGLIADLAVGCDSAGSHAWSYRDDMLHGVSVGAPPDLFNQAGQAWGLTTFSPRAMRNQGFSAFIDMLRSAFACAGGIRIDHILGLRRLWLVPEGESAKNGAYLRYPLEDMLRLIALESWRHRAIVIGEDLGTVPPGFRERLSEHGLAGIRVLWFERTKDGKGFTPPGEWDNGAVGTTTTHDLPTVSGWWRGEDIVWRNRIGQTAARADGRDPVALAQAERDDDRAALWRAFQQAGVAAPDVEPPPPGEAPVDEALAFVAATPSPLVTFPLEDLLGLVDQPNLPGSIDEHPNWRRRVIQPVDALFANDAFCDRLLAIQQARTDSTSASSLSDTP